MRRLWWRLRAAWMMLTGTGAAASVAFGLLVFASVLASLAISRESTGLRTWALQRVIAASPISDRTVIGTAGLTSMSGPAGQVLATDIASVGAIVRSHLAAGGVPVASDPPAWAAMTTAYVPVTGAAQTAGRGRPQVEVAYRTALARYSHMVAGRLPAGGSVPGQGGAVEAAVTAATAARLGLRVGTHLIAGPVLRLVVTGIIQPVHPASAFWGYDPLAAKPVLTPGTSSRPPYWTGAVFIGPGALPLIESRLNPALMQVTWVYPAALGRLTAAQANGLRASIDGMANSAGVVAVPPGSVPSLTVTISSQIPSVLATFVAANRAVAPVLGLLYVSLTVMGAVVVLLGARLVAERRAAEFTLMRARGAALHQLGWLVLRASAVIAVTAGAAAAVLAIRLTPGGGRAGWWLAGITIAVTLVGPVLISVARHRVAAPVTDRPDQPGRWAGGWRRQARRIVIETMLIAGAVGGLFVLRDQGLTGGDRALYPSAAPVLAAIPVAVIVLRCYPPAARELARIAGRSRGVVAFVGLARATRTPPGAALPAFALVLVLTMVAFPAMISASVTRAQVAESWRQVGADAIIQAPAGQVIPPALQHQIASVPGVVSTATGVVDAGSLPSGFELTAVFVDPARYAAVVDRAPGSRFPLAALSENAGDGIIPAVATTAAAQLAGRAPARLSVGTRTITIRVAGRIGGVPGIGGNAVAVMPLRALGPAPPGPALMLAGGSGLDAARLRGAISHALRGGSVTLHAAALAGITGAPVPRAAQAALAQGMAVAAGFGALVLLLSLLLTARTRDMTLARLATMGLRRWQAQLLLAAEALPQVVAATAGGVACAWLLGPLVGPSIDLAAFTGAGPGAAVVPTPFPLAVSAAGLVLTALFVLAAQAVVTYHRGSARALRITE